MKKFFTLILLALLPLLANAYDAEIDGIFYDFSENTATVTYGDQLYNHYTGIVVIPESVTYDEKTYIVTSIGRKAFYACTNLTLITIPNSVISIGSNAFEYCTGLTSFYCLAEKLPQTDLSTFNNTPIENITLHVPASVLESYKTTAPWNNFGKIVVFTECIGDLNGDYKVDIADAVTVLNIMATDNYSEVADVNNDKKVDIADFVTILNIMAQQDIPRKLVTEIVLSETSITLQPDEIKTLTAMVFPKDADNPVVTWKSSDNNVAEVNEKGRIISNNIGTCIITCSATDGSDVKAECQVTVGSSGPDPDEHEYVDLGLPSGTLWATCNVGANSPEECGDYFAWGETTGYNSGKTYFDWGTYKYCQGSYTTFTKYCTDSRYGIVDNKTELDPEDDAATANWGEGWQMPSKTQLSELSNNNYTTIERATLNGKDGSKITSKSNGNSIFIPVAGYRRYGELCAEGAGFYWSNSLYWNIDNYSCYASYLGFGSDHWQWPLRLERYYGFSVRPVRVQGTSPVKLVTSIVLNDESLNLRINETKTLIATILPEDASNKEVTWESSNEEVAEVNKYGRVIANANGTCTISCVAADGSGVKAECKVTVSKAGGDAGFLTCPDDHHPHAIDLGLPSGTKWCCCNVGASTPEGYGGYYAWGETSTKSVYHWNTYKYWNDKDGDGYVDSGECTNIGSDIAGTGYDAATVNMGAPWRMPTTAQQQELINICSRQWTQQNGVNGTLVTGPNGGQVFLPAAGNRWRGELNDAGSYGYYWSSSLYPNTGDYACNLYFSSYYWRWYDSGRCYGFSVRPVCVQN